jgi:hypothetical protein
VLEQLHKNRCFSLSIQPIFVNSCSFFLEKGAFDFYDLCALWHVAKSTRNTLFGGKIVAKCGMARSTLNGQPCANALRIPSTVFYFSYLCISISYACVVAGYQTPRCKNDLDMAKEENKYAHQVLQMRVKGDAIFRKILCIHFSIFCPKSCFKCKERSFITQMRERMSRKHGILWL